ncbi:MAG: DUF1569 domain-containing protein [Planctomycetales bacterium]|nr:DUF1569 domain-containing protein [Planctomycetales bacterium]
MSVKTKQVQGRRTVRYESLRDLLNDAEKLASADVRTLGNWSFGQILKHNAMSLDSSIDGSGFMLPAPVRWLMSLMMKQKFLTKPIPPGFKSPDSFVPGETSIKEGLSALRAAIERQNRETKRALHPGFGQFTNDEWNQFNLRHAEMHMSFVVPNSDV